MRASGRVFACIALVVCLFVGCGYKTSPRPATATVPGDMGLVDAFAYPDRIMLRWEVPAMNADGSPLKDLSGFKIYRLSRKIGEECENCRFEGKPYANVDFQKPVNAEIVDGKVMYNDRNVAHGNVYTYIVAAYNLKGREGKPSPQVPVTFQEPPPAPENVNAHATPNAVTLIWTAPGEKEAVQGYRIYRGSTDALDQMKKVGTTKSDEVSFTDKTVEKDKTYYYVVRSLRVANEVSIESRPSTAVRVTVPGEVETPINVRTNVTTTGIRVSWEQSTITGKRVFYNLYRSEGNGAFQRINIAPIRDSWFLDRKVRRGATYRYAVTAYFEDRPEYESSRAVTEAVRYNR
ncbi:fibronectin type III domain-containing protein [Desulfomonile tiedjei DSM 6799]|uniref:Fibronectin type III domain-containing protein n=2 Tax=Desulfomonile tiedjei TaxID=2358 RepID=I4C850_DESTA|nr:fibronectin type III domain-containing protein [Desulfomonile tiedjei DSM 6799]